MANWEVDETSIPVSEGDREGIKALIVELMLKAPRQVKEQFEHALGIISHADFPDKWPNLMQDLVSRFGDDFRVNIGVLETLNTMFARYRHEMESNEINREILHVLEHLEQPLAALLDATAKECANQLANAASADPAALRTLFEALYLEIEVFFSLVSVDCPSCTYVATGVRACECVCVCVCVDLRG